jgi:tetratricopeptide (TPR) repeat protein
MLNSGDYKAAQAEFERYIAENPQDSEGYIGLGKALSRLGENEEALATLKTAIRFESNSAEAHYGMGITYSNLGKTPEAIEAFKRALHLDPTDPEFHYGAAWAYDKLGDRQQAEFHARKAVALAPDVARYHLLAAKCVRGKDPETTLWHLERVNRLERELLRTGQWHWILIIYRIFAGMMYPAHRLLIVWALFATVSAISLSAPYLQGWLLVAALPFLGISAYSLVKRRYYRALWALGLCLVWLISTYLLAVVW